MDGGVRCYDRIELRGLSRIASARGSCRRLEEAIFRIKIPAVRKARKTRLSWPSGELAGSMSLGRRSALVEGSEERGWGIVGGARRGRAETVGAPGRTLYR